MKNSLTGAQTPLLSKLLLYMKVTAFFLLVFALHVSGKGISQDRLNLNFENKEIAFILSHIEKQTDYRFLYDNKLSAVRQRVSVSVTEAGIREALEALLRKTGLTYQIMDHKLIVIKKGQPASVQRIISGKITDENGSPLAGVSVNVKGTNRGTTTNEQGQFQIEASDGETLVFSYIGYSAQEIKVTAAGDVNLALAATGKALDDLVVIGYGQVKKRDLTGSVLSVKGDEIRKVPSSNVIESLQGKLAGADITRTNGSAASGVSITIRGNRSLKASNGPLIIVDGIQYNNIQDINANDIQSLEVLKDASSTAIYGSRGANGVIIITTRKGTAGKPKISLNSYYGVSNLDLYPRYMTSSEYVAVRREANRRITLAGINPGGNWTGPANDNLLFSPLELTNINNGVNTNYADLLFRKGSQQEHQVGVAAGSDKTKVYMSLSYYNEEGIFQLDELKRYSGRLNIDQTLGKMAKAGMQFQYTQYNIDTRTNPLDEAAKIAPFSLPYDTLGNVNKIPNNDAARWNPLIDEQPGISTNNTELSRTFGVAYVELTPFKGFSLRSNLGLLFTNSRQGAFYDVNSLLQRGTNSLGNYTTGKGINTSWENIISYNKQVNEHNFTFTGVTTYLQNKNEEVSAQGNKLILPSQLYYALQNATEGITIRSAYQKENLISFSGRVNYSFKGKYLASFTVRTDGSSKLGEGNKWDVFPAIALGWRLIDEPFLMNVGGLSDLKLRVSYGITGNDAISPYRTQSSLTRIPNAFGDNQALGLTFSDTVGNPNLKWEKTKAFNVGVDIGLFNNRINGTIDFYRTQTSDLLTIKQLPPTSGVSYVYDNVGETSNIGLDIGINAAIINKKNIGFNAGLTFYTNKEEITAMANGVDDVANKWFIGHPVRVSYDYRKTGIWQLADSAAALAFGQRPGDIRVADIVDDKKITPADREVVGQLVPKWNASLNLDFRYKAFDFNIFLFARVGQTIEYEYYTRFHLPGRENGAAMNYWTLENPSNDFPRPRTTSSFAALPYSSTLQYADGTFLKVRSATIGFNVPKTFSSRFGMSNVRLYVTGRNLFTFAKIKNYDPERGGSLNNPLTQLFIGGINVDF
jgi:TonB-linked SusC/RagA family outer membrane protein